MKYMTPKDVPNPVSVLENLQILATENTDNGWQQVDGIISKDGFCDQEENWHYATQVGLYDEDPNMWDLSASIIAGAKSHRGKLGEQVANRLREIMKMSDNDDATYARYRCAFALFEHGVKDQEVLAVIQEATSDDAVKEIAEGYLKQS